MSKFLCDRLGHRPDGMPLVVKGIHGNAALGESGFVYARCARCDTQYSLGVIALPVRSRETSLLNFIRSIKEDVNALAEWPEDKPRPPEDK